MPLHISKLCHDSVRTHSNCLLRRHIPIKIICSPCQLLQKSIGHMNKKGCHTLPMVAPYRLCRRVASCGCVHHLADVPILKHFLKTLRRKFDRPGSQTVVTYELSGKAQNNMHNIVALLGCSFPIGQSWQRQKNVPYSCHRLFNLVQFSSIFPCVYIVGMMVQP